MKILHTADWHIGKKLYTVSRIDEQRAVLDEIAALCDSRGIDVVTVAGDVYDTTTIPTACPPPTRSLSACI